MGVKAALRHNYVLHDPSESGTTGPDPSGSKASAPTSSSRALEKQPSQRRKVDSVLDDIMGDPDDFRDLVDSDAESDGGRWEDAVRAALEHEEAGVGAVHPDIRDSKDGLSKTSHEANVTNDSLYKHSQSPSSIGDTGQDGKGRQQKPQESEGRKNSSVLTVSSGSKDNKLYHTRYFIIKSLNHHNISKSIEKGIWATQAMNEPVLNEAFETSERVLLVFSVNMSGHFQGYAQMTSPIGRRRANVWSEANEGANPWGGTFSVDWLRLHDLAFQKTVHLKNPLNFFKPVKISRDCQELTQEVGDALCALIDEGADRDGRPKRKVIAADLAAYSSKRRRESVGMPKDGSQSRQQMNGGGARFSATCPPMFSPGVANDPFSSQGPMSRSSGGFSSQASYPVKALGVSKSKSHPVSSDRSLDHERHERETGHRERERHLERDRPKNHTRSSSNGRSADLTVEEDLLNMTYEEYLQRHGHSRDFTNGYQQSAGPHYVNSSSPGFGGNWIGRNGAIGFQEDQYSNYITNWYSRQGSNMGGDVFQITNGMGNCDFAGMWPPDANWPGQTDDPRVRRRGRHVDGKAGPGYLGHSVRVSRRIERITEASS